MFRGFGCIVLITISFCTDCFAEDRYPFRLPEWVWRGDEISRFLMPYDLQRLERGVKQINDLPPDAEEESDRLTYSLSRDIASSFAARDLLVGATIVSDSQTQRSIAVHLDPVFSDEMKPILHQAVAIFLRYATHPDIIQQAFDRAEERPEPFPPKEVDDKEKTKLIPNPFYRNYLQGIVKPKGPAVFSDQMSSVLMSSSTRMPLLVIASYSGNAWWGGAYNDYYYDSRTRLNRLEPQGYLYLRLNTDRMVVGQIRYNDPKFWASKLSHELLHNLGYWHPPYKDPQERDTNTKEKAPFIVGYEQAMLEKLSQE